jgi:UDP-glucose 4-epimerase
MSLGACVVIGAAGFIGSHLVDRLLAEGYEVVGIDSLLLGKRSNLVQAFHNPNFSFLESDVNDFNLCVQLLRPLTERAELRMVWHLAANSDIRAGSADPEVDLRNTFLSTFNVLKIVKLFRIPALAFASSSAIYGNYPRTLTEDSGPLFPVSNYGAMKLASEGIISAALETFLKQAWIFRFPNVVGSRTTHGIIHDLMKRLRQKPAALEVLGDGLQEKPYLHVSELVDAMFFIFRHAQTALNYFNIGTDGSTTTVKYIAEAVVQKAAPGTAIRYQGGSKGWPGDVAKYSYSIEKLRSLGWSPPFTSDQAIDRAIEEVAKEISG